MEPDNQPELGSIFVNPNGVLCREVTLFGKPRYCAIDVRPVFDGFDIHGNIINREDYVWIPLGIETP